jgi:hypothetical protein
MKQLLIILLMTPMLAFGEVATRSLFPVVRVQPDMIFLKDRRGNDWQVETDCQIDTQEITQFKVRAKRVKEGTQIQFAEDLVCKVESIRQA